MKSLERWLAATFLFLASCGSGASAPAAAPAPAAAAPGAATAPAASPAPPAPAEGAAAASSVRLYALDCGHADIKDMTFFGDDGGPRDLVAACYLIRHPRGTMLWDTGVSDRYAEPKGGTAIDPRVGIRFYVKTPLRDSLAALNLAPADVNYVVFSHMHTDHAGNANLFPTSTWVVNRQEWAFATRTPPGTGVDPSLFSAHRTATMKLLDGETDLFGDGTVKIVPTPGHTPGHQSLIVALQRAGTIIISGDLCHTHENWEKRRVPPFNTDREETLRSMARMGALVDATRARFVVQHEPDELAKFPPFPAYLD